MSGSCRNGCRMSSITLAFGCALLFAGAMMAGLLYWSQLIMFSIGSLPSQFKSSAEGTNREDNALPNIWDRLRTARPKARDSVSVEMLLMNIPAGQSLPSCDAGEMPTTYDGDYRVACPDASCSRVQRIPKLLHCSWESDKIPQSYARVMKTFAHHHPDWRVMFWSDASIAWFLEENYPAFYQSVFTRYKRPIERVDSFRYFVLYHYGGVYADSDFLFFQPLDAFLHHHAVLPREPEPNALALLTNTRFMASNALMMTAPRHPLFLDILLHLQHASPLSSDDYLFTAGPLMVHRLFAAYELRSPCTRREAARVYAPPSHYFWPYTRSDFIRRGRDVFVRRWCGKFESTYNRSDPQVAAMCEDPTDVDALADTGPKVTPFTSHLNKVNYPGMRVESETGVSHIEEVHPTYVTYADLRDRVPRSCFSGGCSRFLRKHRILPDCVACYDSIL